MKQDWKWILGGVTGLSVLAAFAVLNLQDAIEGAAAPFADCHRVGFAGCYLNMPRAMQIGILVQLFAIVAGVAFAYLLAKRLWFSLTGRSGRLGSQERAKQIDIEDESDARVIHAGAGVVVHVHQGAAVNFVTDSDLVAHDRRLIEQPLRREIPYH